MRDPLESFQTLQEFFTRALQEGVRPIDPAPEALVEGMVREREGCKLGPGRLEGGHVQVLEVRR